MHTLITSISNSKAAFESTSNWFRKWFFGKWDVWLLLKIRSNWKWFQFDRKIRWRGAENNFRSHFHFKSLPPQENRRERERQHWREIAPAPAKARLIHIQELRRTQKTQDRACSSSNAQIVRSRTHFSDRRARPSNPFLISRTQKSSNPFVTDCHKPRNRRTIRQTWDRLAESPICLLWVDFVINPLALFDLWFSCCCCGGVGVSCFVVLWFWVDLWFDEFFFVRYWEFGFWWIWILLELMIYLFGSWENARKCEKHDKIGFFRAFSRIQPNTRKYFPKNILECN